MDKSISAMFTSSAGELNVARITCSRKMEATVVLPAIARCELERRRWCDRRSMLTAPACWFVPTTSVDVFSAAVLALLALIWCRCADIRFRSNNLTINGCSLRSMPSITQWMSSLNFRESKHMVHLWCINSTMSSCKLSVFLSRKSWIWYTTCPAKCWMMNSSESIRGLA